MRCDAKDCENEAKTSFIAIEQGELVGHRWCTGDVISLCWAHAQKDVYRSIGGPETMEGDP